MDILFFRGVGQKRRNSVLVHPGFIFVKKFAHCTSYVLAKRKNWYSNRTSPLAFAATRASPREMHGMNGLEKQFVFGGGFLVKPMWIATIRNAVIPTNAHGTSISAGIAADAAIHLGFPETHPFFQAHRIEHGQFRRSEFSRRNGNRFAKNNISQYSARSYAAIALALGVQLAGDAWYFGKRHEKPVIGDKLRKIEAEDIRRAHRLLYGTAVLGVIVLLLLRAALGVLLCCF